MFCQTFDLTEVQGDLKKIQLCSRSHHELDITFSARKWILEYWLCYICMRTDVVKTRSDWLLQHLGNYVQTFKNWFVLCVRVSSHGMHVGRWEGPRGASHGTALSAQLPTSNMSGRCDFYCKRLASNSVKRSYRSFVEGWRSRSAGTNYSTCLQVSHISGAGWLKSSRIQYGAYFGLEMSPTIHTPFWLESMTPSITSLWNNLRWDTDFHWLIAWAHQHHTVWARTTVVLVKLRPQSSHIAPAERETLAVMHVRQMRCWQGSRNVAWSARDFTQQTQAADGWFLLLTAPRNDSAGEHGTEPGRKWENSRCIEWTMGCFC